MRCRRFWLRRSLWSIGMLALLASVLLLTQPATAGAAAGSWIRGEKPQGP